MKSIDSTRIFESGQQAAAHLTPGQIFFVPNEFMACGYETRRLVEEPGFHLSRGEFGVPVYSETAVYEDNDHLRMAKFGEVEWSRWMVWDCDFGWL